MEQKPNERKKTWGKNTTNSIRIFSSFFWINWTQNEWQRTPNARKYGYSIRWSYGKYIKTFFFRLFYFSFPHFAVSTLLGVCLLFFSWNLFFSNFPFIGKLNECMSVWMWVSVCWGSYECLYIGIGIAATTTATAMLAVYVFVPISEMESHTILRYDLSVNVAWFLKCPMRLCFA